MSPPPLDPETVKVHIASSDVDLASSTRPRRKRIALSARQFQLTTSDPVQLILPESDSRVYAWLIVNTATNPVYVGGQKADAQQAANSGALGAAQIPSQVRWDLPTTDPVWAAAPSASLPLTLTVTAFYEQPDP